MRLKLDCSRALNDDRGISFSLLIGTTKGIQVLKKGRLQMDLKQTDTHYELGQYTDAQKEGFIPVLKVNKETLNNAQGTPGMDKKELLKSVLEKKNKVNRL